MGHDPPSRQELVALYAKALDVIHKLRVERDELKVFVVATSKIEFQCANDDDLEAWVHAIAVFVAEAKRLCSD